MVLMQTDAKFEDLHHWAVTIGKTRLSHTHTHNAWNKDGRFSHLDWRFEEYDRFMQELMKVMTEGPKGGAKRFFRALDLNTELGFLCMNDDDEMKEIYEPQCCGMVSRQTREVSKKAMWMVIRKEVSLFELGRA